MLLTWLVVLWRARRFAIPLAFVAAVVVIVVTGSLDGVGGADLVPQLTWTTPHPDLAAAVSLGLPLYLVTMTGHFSSLFNAALLHEEGWIW